MEFHNGRRVMPSIKSRITLTVVDRLQPGDIVFDDKLSGFGVRRQTGKARYFVQTRLGGKLKWFTIGAHGVFTPDQARKRAQEWLLEARDGKDPTIERAKLAAIPTFAEAAQDFIDSHGRKLKPRTREEYQRLIRLHLNPVFGKRRIDDIRRKDVEDAHSEWATTPRAANHAIACLSKIMSWAEQREYRRDLPNPCRGIEKNKEVKRERYLTADEFTALDQALDAANDRYPEAVNALRLLILTGARLNEILTLRWAYVDLERRVLALPDSKTGKKNIPLNQPAIDLLATIPRISKNPWVITGAVDGSHLVNLQKPWREIRTQAGLPDVRIHDLRHSFASMAISTGTSLPILGRILGHASPQTTARYAHIADTVAGQLAEATGQRLVQAMQSVASNKK